MNKHLEWMAENSCLPFDLDFLRELGFEFKQDWDGQIIIETPETIDVVDMVALIVKFDKAIKKRLKHERQKAHCVCVGGPKNGASCFGRDLSRPILFHLARGQWAVYEVKNHGLDDTRAWYVGTATNEKKAKNKVVQP